VELSPILLATLGEVAIILLIALIYSIRQYYLSRQKLKALQVEHTDLQEQHAVVSEQKQTLEQAQGKDASTDLLRETIALLRELYSKSGHEDLDNHETDSFDHTADNASLILAYQVLIAQLNAIDNSKDAEGAWHNIDEHLQPLLSSLFASPAVAEPDEQADLAVIDELKQKIADQEGYIEELELTAANQRETEVDSSTIETLEQQISDQKKRITELELAAEDSTPIASPADKEKFSAGVAETSIITKQESGSSASTDLLHQGLKNSQGEIDDLRNKVANQHDTIRDLELKLVKGEGGEELNPETQQAMDSIKQNLRDSEMCIETMDMEITSAHEEIAKLEAELKQLNEQNELGEKKSDLIQNFAQDTKQLLDCITVLENSAEEQHTEIEDLKEKLATTEAEKQALEELSNAFQQAFDTEDDPNAFAEEDLTQDSMP